jgi:DnaJ-class molecular chaperone
LNRGGRGDEVVIVNVVVPTNLDASQKRLLAELGKTLDNEARPEEEKSFFERLREALGI